MGAKLEELAAGLHGNVTRADAKGLAKLHGHRWFDLRHAMLKIGPLAFREEKVAAFKASIPEDAEVYRSVLDGPGDGLRAVVIDWAERGWLSGS